jgi:hypothetical protein
MTYRRSYFNSTYISNTANKIPDAKKKKKCTPYDLSQIIFYSVLKKMYTISETCSTSQHGQNRERQEHILTKFHKSTNTVNDELQFSLEKENYSKTTKYHYKLHTNMIKCNPCQ